MPTSKDCKCGGLSHVIDSRDSEFGWRRRRECHKCGQRWSTVEVKWGSSGRLDDLKSALGAVQVIVADIQEMLK